MAEHNRKRPSFSKTYNFAMGWRGETSVMLRGSMSRWDHFSDLDAPKREVRFAPDSVAKVALPKVSKFLRAAGAFFV